MTALRFDEFLRLLVSPEYNQDTIADLWQAFDAIDADKSGKISASESRTAAERACRTQERGPARSPRVVF